METGYLLDGAQTMNILHVIASVKPRDGGPSVCAPSLAASQARLGHDVTLAFHGESGNGLDLDWARHSVPHIDLVEWVDVPRGRGLAWLAGGTLASHLAQYIARADVVHLHGVWDPIVLRAASLAFRHDTKYVFTPHGMLNPWSLSQKPLRKKVVMRALLRRLLAGATFIHALTRDEEDAIRTLDASYSVRVIPNGVFLDAHKPAGTTELLDHLPQLKGRNYILFLGRLHHMKGLDYAVQGFARFARTVPDVDWVVAGPDAGEKQGLLESIQALGIADRVHIVGPLLGSLKDAALRNASCLLQPSRNEGFSMSILEALAAGVPVVISQHCNFDEVADAEVGAVVPLDAQAISDALVTVCTMPEGRIKTARKARQMLAERYNWGRIATAMLNEYGHETDSAQDRVAARAFSAKRGVMSSGG